MRCQRISLEDTVGLTDFNLRGDDLILISFTVMSNSSFIHIYYRYKGEESGHIFDRQICCCGFENCYVFGETKESPYDLIRKKG